MADATTPCAICKKPASTKNTSFSDYKHFDCPECGEFRASGTFMAAVEKLPLTTRRQALQRAIVRANYGALPLVTTYDVP
jgi:hypothetical protein